MAVAARPPAAPGQADLRMACPVCGGSIHPVAGRCKHCRTDLVKLRQDHARRQDPLIQMQAPHPATGPAAAAATTYSAQGYAPALPAPQGVPWPAAELPTAVGAGHRPAMPQASSPQSVGVARRSTWSRTWPWLAVVIAVIAIAVSTLLLFFEDRGHADARPLKKRLAAPEPMDTAPLPSAPVAPADPWKNMPAPDPGSTAPDIVPDPTDPMPPQIPDDPLPDPDSAPQGNVPPQGANVAPRPSEFSASLIKTACSRLAACGAMAPSEKKACEEAASLLATSDVDERVRTGECKYDRDRANRCLRMFAQLPCGDQDIDITKFVDQADSIQDCAAALKCS